MNAENIIWSSLYGGYKIPYDASIPLKELEVTEDVDLTNSIFNTLWNELHHQGDVGTASYYAVPVLIKICIDKKSFDWNYIGLCLLIEHCRYDKRSPPLPKELEDHYFISLRIFEEYLLSNYREIKDNTAFQLMLSLFATLNGQPELGIVIERLDQDLIIEFIKNYG